MSKKILIRKYEEFSKLAGKELQEIKQLAKNSEYEGLEDAIMDMSNFFKHLNFIMNEFLKAYPAPNLDFKMINQNLRVLKTLSNRMEYSRKVRDNNRK